MLADLFKALLVLGNATLAVELLACRARMVITVVVRLICKRFRACAFGMCMLQVLLGSLGSNQDVRARQLAGCGIARAAYHFVYQSEHQ